MLNRKLDIWLILAISAGFCLPGLGLAHVFDWDEINFAEAAREMIVTGDYLRVHIGYLPFYQKPPLFIWLQAVSMHLFGVGEYGARFPNAICGILTALVLFKMGSRLRDARLGMLWALAHLGSFLPLLYFRSGIIDPWFNLFILLSFWSFFRAYAKRTALDSTTHPSPWRNLLMAGVWAGLGVLTKGPVAILLVALALVVIWILKRFSWYLKPIQFVVALGVAGLTAGLWFGAEMLLNGPEFMTHFIDYQIRLLGTEDAGHGGFPGYHFVVVFAGCFPASIFALAAFKSRGSLSAHLEQWRVWMIVMLFVVLGVFTLVQTKIVHYSSMAYFPVSFLAAYSLDAMLDSRYSLRRWQTRTLLALGGLFALLFLALPFVMQQKDWLIANIKDPFAKLNLQADVAWSGAEALIGVLLIATLVVWQRNWRRPLIERVSVLFLGCALTLVITTCVIVGKIEGYSQRAAIDYYKSLQGREDFYVHPVNYKSYAHLFYSRFMPPENPDYYVPRHKDDYKHWLLYEQTERPVYGTGRMPKGQKLADETRLELIDQRNGFGWFRWEPEKWADAE